MAVNEVHVGDTGTPFVVTVEKAVGVPYPLSSFASYGYVFQKPDGSVLDVDAAFVTDGSDGELTRVWADGDLDQAGTWKYQVRFASGSESHHTDVGKFKVYPNIPLG